MSSKPKVSLGLAQLRAALELKPKQVHRVAAGTRAASRIVQAKGAVTYPAKR